MKYECQGPKFLQSTLKDISGKAIPDGDVEVTFRLYTEQVGGTALWEETTVVTVVGGICSHKLGLCYGTESIEFWKYALP